MTETPEVWLYGSQARGDADALSDTDLLIVGDSDSLVQAVVAAAEVEYPRIQPSFYDWNEIERMARYGSLFLHHIATEGLRLESSSRHPERFTNLLSNLPIFSRADEDLFAFRSAIHECRESLLSGGWADFECEVVATVTRHAAILGSYLAGEPTFSREQPFYVCGRALRWPSEDVETLARLSTVWRKHLIDRRLEPETREGWLKLVSSFIDDLESFSHDRHRLLPTAA